MIAWYVVLWDGDPLDHGLPLGEVFRDPDKAERAVRRHAAQNGRLRIIHLPG